MSEKKEEKSPYPNHTTEEVLKTEAGNYYIQVGDDMFESQYGKLAFNRDKAEKFFMAAWRGLQEMKENGSEEDKAEALECLLNFRIIPLRFH